MIESSNLIQTILVAPTGIMGSSLRTFLKTIPGVQIVVELSCPGEVLPALSFYQPHSLLLDADTANSDLATWLGQLRSVAPALNLIVLTSSWDQHQAALSAGASYALFKGYLDDQLRQAILSAQRPSESK